MDLVGLPCRLKYEKKCLILTLNEIMQVCLFSLTVMTKMLKAWLCCPLQCFPAQPEGFGSAEPVPRIPAESRSPHSVRELCLFPSFPHFRVESVWFLTEKGSTCCFTLRKNDRNAFAASAAEVNRNKNRALCLASRWIVLRNNLTVGLFYDAKVNSGCSSWNHTPHLYLDDKQLSHSVYL